MHILFLCTSFPYPENDSYKQTVMQTVRALYRKGVQVTILAQVSDSHTISIESIPLEVRKWANYYIVEIEQKLSFLDKFTSFLFSAATFFIFSLRELQI